MDISGYGSGAYQSQLGRYNEIIRKNAEERERRRNSTDTDIINQFADVLVLNEKGEVTGKKDVLTGEYTEAGLYRAVPPLTFSSDTPVINISELLEKAMSECRRPVFDISNIHTIDFSEAKPIWEIYTKVGDPANDASVVAGYFYQKSCIDLTYSDDYYSMTASEDFTGMSKTEIYRAIYQKYQHCYGERFLDMKAVDFISPPDTYNDNPYLDIIKNFNREIKNACGLESYYERFALRRDALYPDMSDEEIEQAIIDEYTERLGSDITNMDICKMCEEMQNCGVGHGARNMFNPQWNFEVYGAGTSIISVDAQSSWLNSKASKKTFDQVYNAYLDKFNYTAPFDHDVGSIILRIKSAVCPKITYHT